MDTGTHLIVSLVQKSVAHFRRLVNTTVQRFAEKRELGRAQTCFAVASQIAHCVYECALNRIELSNGHAHIALLRLWACTTGSGRSDARRKVRHRGPARYKMERIYV